MILNVVTSHEGINRSRLNNSVNIYSPQRERDNYPQIESTYQRTQGDSVPLNATQIVN